MIEQGKERIRRIREKIAELSKIDPSNYLSQDELQKIKSKFSIKVSSNTQHYPKLDEEITRPKPIVQNPLKKKFRNVCNLDTQYFKQLHIKLDVEVQEKLKQNMENIKKWRLVGVKNINRVSEDNKDSYDFLGQSQRDGQIDQHLNNKQDENLNKNNVCKQLENQKEENPNKQAVIDMILDKKQEQKQVETKNTVGLFSNTSPSLLFANSHKQTENKPFFGLFPTAAPVSLFSNLTKEQKGAEIKPIVEHINTNSSPLFQIPAKNNPTIGLFPTSSIISPASLLSNPPNQSEAKPTLGLFSKTATAPASLFSNFIKQPEVKPSIGFFSNATPTLLFPSSLKEKNQSENKSATEIFPIKAQSPLFSNSFKESEAKPTGALFSNTTSTSLFPNSTKQTEQKPTLGLFSSTTPKPLFQNHLKEQKQIETKPTIGLFSISPISNPPKQAEKKPSIGLFPGAAQTSLFSNPSQQPKQPETKPASGLFANTAPIFANPAKQDETKPNSGPSISASPISLFPNPPKEKIQLHTKPVVGLFSNKPSLPLSSNLLLTEEKPAAGLFSNITPVQSFNPPKQAENKPTIGLFNSLNAPSLFTNIASSSLFPSSNKQSETKPSIGLFSSSSQVPLFPSVPKQAEIKPHIGITSNAAPTLLFPSFSKQTEAKPLFSNTTSSSLFSNSAKQTDIKHTSGLFNAAPTSLPPHTPKQSEIQPSGGLFTNMTSSPASLHSNTSSGLIFSSLPKEQKQSENKPTVGLFGTTTQPSLFLNPLKQQKQADNKLSAIGPGGTKLSLHSFNIKQVNKSQSSNPFKSINPFMQSAQSSSFLNPNPPSNLPNPSNTLFSNSLFSLPSNSNSGGLFSNLQKSIFNKQSNAQIPDAEQDEGQQDDDGPIVAQDDANPQLSTVKYDYVQTTVHFKQPANKFREGTKETLENVVVSIEQFQGSEDVFLFIRMQNKCITFNGKILKNITQTRILNNNSKNVEVKKILSVKDSASAKPQLSIIRLQFKQSEIGSLFVKKFEKASKMNPQ